MNLKPLLPGHVLVCPHEPHRRLTDLSAPELTDLFQAVQRVQRMLARHYFSSSSSAAAAADDDHASPPPPADPEAGSFNIAIQDGAGAGQTVPHVHVHVIPRIAGATDKVEGAVGDAVYEQMASEEGNVGGALWDRDRDGGRVSAAAKAKAKAENNSTSSGSSGSLPGEGEGEGQGGRPVPGGAFARIEDAGRRPRSPEEMAAEAEVFRAVLAAMARDESRREGAADDGGGAGRS